MQYVSVICTIFAVESVLNYFKKIFKNLKKSQKNDSKKLGLIRCNLLRIFCAELKTGIERFKIQILGTLRNAVKNRLSDCFLAYYAR